ncbi:M28 family metallopeptidase [Zhouia sp. PK063]|uniref:M28 family metallopeptidase n=1 Tax=Zhouia sp. PK063 TaxID=3373602 RepID=UPI0037B5A847
MKLRYIHIISAVLLALLLGQKGLAQAKKVNYASATDVKNIMSVLASDDMRGREAGSEEIKKAASYIEGIFKENHIKPYFSSYNDTLTNFQPTTYNVVGYLEGTDPKLKNELVVLGGHYDHIGIQKPIAGDSIANGANDDASGSTAVIEMAKYFGSKHTNKRSMLFVLFTGEEKGLLGSKHLAKRLKEENANLYCMVNFEMIGVPMTRDYLLYITGYNESNMAKKMNEYSGGNTIGFLETAKQYNLFKRSDNYSFYKEMGVPSQTVCTFDFTNFDFYHHVDDELDKMDFNHMSNVVNTMIPVIEKIVTTPTQEIKINQE